MVQRQYTDDEMAILARAVRDLNYACRTAQAESNRPGRPAQYVHHTYGTNSLGIRVNNYSVSVMPFGSSRDGLSTDVVAKYVRGREVAI